METATRPVAGWCLGCGGSVTADEAFCPACGTRQVPDRPMPVDRIDEQAERLARSANAWLLAAFVAAALLVFVTAVLAGWFTAEVSDDDTDPIGRNGAASVDDGW